MAGLSNIGAEIGALQRRLGQGWMLRLRQTLVPGAGWLKAWDLVRDGQEAYCLHKAAWILMRRGKLVCVEQGGEITAGFSLWRLASCASPSAQALPSSSSAPAPMPGESSAIPVQSLPPSSDGCPECTPAEPASVPAPVVVTRRTSSRSKRRAGASVASGAASTGSRSASSAKRAKSS